MAAPEDLALTVKEVEALDRRIVARQADVRDEAGLAAAFTAGVAEVGPVDIVLANAGIAPMSLHEPHAAWQDVVDVNLTGVFNTVETAIPSMIERGRGGAIVLTSSTAGINGIGGPSRGGLGYAAAKHGVVGLMRSYANNLAPHSIRVNSVHSTGVNTPMVVNDAMQEFLAQDPSLSNAMANALPVPMVEPVDISNAIVWLDLKALARFAPEGLTHPRYLLRWMRSGHLPQLTVPNMAVGDAPAPTFFGAYGQWMQSALPSWDDVRWLREQLDGPFMLKGVTRIDDAKRAVDVGVTAISVSNHAGNYLDGTPATIRALPAVAAAVGDQVEVLLDGGVRRGGDVVKALALGARAVMIGRAYLWGLAANGQAGVENVLDILRAGIDSAVLGLGHSSSTTCHPPTLSFHRASRVSWAATPGRSLAARAGLDRISRRDPTCCPAPTDDPATRGRRLVPSSRRIPGRGERGRAPSPVARVRLRPGPGRFPGRSGKPRDVGRRRGTAPVGDLRLLCMPRRDAIMVVGPRGRASGGRELARTSGSWQRGAWPDDADRGGQRRGITVARQHRHR
jgi:NAD(P)-dependent dehydrogenase (short-subunit alcohol dehydrogenase family)